MLKFQESQGKENTKLFVTGHSLGGALSVLCGIRLALKYRERQVQVINFGCPKVGCFSSPLTDLLSPDPDPDLLAPTPNLSQGGEPGVLSAREHQGEPVRAARRAQERCHTTHPHP